MPEVDFNTHSLNIASRLVLYLSEYIRSKGHLLFVDFI